MLKVIDAVSCFDWFIKLISSLAKQLKFFNKTHMCGCNCMLGAIKQTKQTDYFVKFV